MKKYILSCCILNAMLWLQPTNLLAANEPTAEGPAVGYAWLEGNASGDSGKLRVKVHGLLLRKTSITVQVKTVITFQFKIKGGAYENYNGNRYEPRRSQKSDGPARC